MCVQFVIIINALIIIIVIKLNSIILSYTILRYCTALNEIYYEIYKTDYYGFSLFAKMRKHIIAHLHSIFIAINKTIGFEKVILNIDS